VATPLPTLTVRFRVTGPDPVTLTLVGERVTPLGAPTRERETVPVKPPCGVMVSCGGAALTPLLDGEACGVEGEGEVGGATSTVDIAAANTSN
jgi:hypothetical protein